MKLSGRTQAELARASHWTEGMVSKVLKLKARPNWGVFRDFQAPFLVAQGGITDAQQIVEMARLLDSAVTLNDLRDIAAAVERYTDPLQSAYVFRDRAAHFRDTIASAFQPARVPPPAQPEDSPPEPEPSPAEVLAQWQAALSRIPPVEASDTLQVDDVIVTMLEWERRQTDNALVARVWDWVGPPEHAARLRRRAYLAFMLEQWSAAIPLNELEWRWLDHLLHVAARRHFGQAQVSPSQMTAFVLDLGYVAWEAIRRSDGDCSHPAVRLVDLRPNLPTTQGARWDWLTHVARSDSFQVRLADDELCEFASRDEAEFLAAHFVLNLPPEQALQGIIRQAGRPFGVLRQAMRILHFARRDDEVVAAIAALLDLPDAIPLRYLDAMELLVACEAPDSPKLQSLFYDTEARLCQSWADIRAPEYRLALARVMRPLGRSRLQRSARLSVYDDPTDETALRCMALLGGDDAIEALAAHTMDAPALQRVLAVAHELPPAQAIVLFLRLISVDPAQVCQALAQLQTIPAIRTLRHLAAHITEAQAALAELRSPVYAGLMAHELDTAQKAPDEFQSRLGIARRLALQAPKPLPALTRVLAQALSDPHWPDAVRYDLAWALLALNDPTAFRACLRALPFVDRSDSLIASLLPSLAASGDAPLLWELLGQSPSAAQRLVLVRCLGQAQGMQLDARFDALLTEADDVAVAALEALAASAGAVAGERLAQIAEQDVRLEVRLAAQNALIGLKHARALAFLHARLSDEASRWEAAQQLARWHQPVAEQLLVQAAQQATDERVAEYVAPLAHSGGPIAVRALYLLLGPEPDISTVFALRTSFVPDTTRWAADLWPWLAQQPSLAWRMLAAVVLAQGLDSRQVELALQLALDDPDIAVRRCAQDALGQAQATAPGSVETISYLLTWLERDSLLPDGVLFAREWLVKMVRDLLQRGVTLPDEVARRILERAHAWIEQATPRGRDLPYWVSMLAFPLFAPAAPWLEPFVTDDHEAAVQLAVMDALVGMRPPGLMEWLIRVARSSQQTDVRERARRALAEIADFGTLLRLPKELRDVAVSAALVRDVRVHKDGFRHKIIAATGLARF